MSTYWIFVNHTKQERIDPDYIGRGAAKMHEVVNSDAARVLTHVMMGRWAGDHVTCEPDGDLGRLATFLSWPEVSEDAVHDFNLQITPPTRVCEENLPRDLTKR